tara:strand:+ start:880 stop:1374 length:495 start_codon:yes stop_codon:yes gene_type:complete
VAQIDVKKIYRKIISVAKFAVLGISFSVESELSSLNNCIPPTPRFGRIETALTIIPIPPNHCKRLRQTIMPSDVFSILLIIVDPVVVNPDTDSKKALVIPVTFDESRKGNEEKIDKTIQLKVTRRNALFVFSSLLFPLDTRKNINPEKLVIIELIIKLFQPGLL